MAKIIITDEQWEELMAKYEVQNLKKPNKTYEKSESLLITYKETFEIHRRMKLIDECQNILNRIEELDVNKLQELVDEYKEFVGYDEYKEWMGF